jgi:hypothetical protein
VAICSIRTDIRRIRGPLLGECQPKCAHCNSNSRTSGVIVLVQQRVGNALA